MMQQQNLRRISPFRFRRAIQDHFRSSPWGHLIPAPRSIPSGANRHHSSPIVNKLTFGNEAEFRRMFRLSRTVFAALVTELSPWIKSGRSNNGNQNVSVEAKIAIALYFMAHGGNGFTLGVAAGLNDNTALSYLHEVSALISDKLKDRWMGQQSAASASANMAHARVCECALGCACMLVRA